MIERRSLLAALAGLGAFPKSGASFAAHATTMPFEGVRAVLRQAVAKGIIRGGQVLVLDDGITAFEEAEGLAGVSGNLPMKPDTVVSLQSLTKVPVAVSILMLKEQGKLALADPVSRFIPQLKALNRVRVLKPGSPSPYQRLGQVASSPPEYDIVQAEREITLRDLLTHTSGLQQLDLSNAALPPVTDTDSLATWVPKVAVMPLDHQPGAAWGYSNIVGFDVLARVVEVAGGEPIDRFMQERIFTPLGMADTGFGARYDNRAPRAESQGPTTRPAVAEGRAFKSGAAGLWGTLRDYATFMQMLADGGLAGRHRLLQARTVRMMRTNAVGTLYRGSNLGGRPGRPGLGFGLGVQIVIDAAAAGAGIPSGSYGWEGFGGSKAWVIPSQKRVLVLKTSSAPTQLALERAVAATRNRHCV